MAHMIDSMMYVGETPWHKLGTALDKPPTTEEALLQAGLNWTVKKLPTFSPNLDNDEEYFGNHASMRTGHYHTWRINNPSEYGNRTFVPLGPVSERYGVLQNKEAI